MHVTYCTIRRGVLIKKILLVLENVYLINCHTITYEFSTWGSNI